MRICHVTPHLPPDQAANALLPLHLGNWARESGDEPLYVAHPPRAAGRSDLPGTVTWIPMHRVGLLENKRCTCQSTVDIIERDLRPAPVAARFRAVYREAVETRR